MKIQLTFWTKIRRIVGSSVEHDGRTHKQVNRLIDLILPAARNAQHQAASELFSLLGRLPNAPQLGLLLGKQIPVTAFGEISLGMKVAPTFRDVLQVTAGFHQYAVPLMDYSYRETKSEGRFLIGFRCPIDSYGEAFLVALVASMIETDSARFSGRSGNIKKLELTQSSKGYESAYRRHLSVIPDRDHSHNAVVLDRAVLDLPNPVADPETFDSVVSAFMARADLQKAGLSRSDQVRELVTSGISDPPSLDRLAASLQLTQRQLRLALAKENTSYREIVRSCHIEYASALLRNSSLSLSQIAHRLGYSDLSAFTHAFIRWTGKSPSSFRIEMLSQPASP